MEKKLEKKIGKQRLEHIQNTKKQAIKNDHCKEKINGKCMYPHCGCLFGEKD